MQRKREMAHPAFRSCIAHAHRGLTWLRHKQKQKRACKGLAEESYVDDATTYARGSRGDHGAFRHCCLRVCPHVHGPRTQKCQPVVAESITQCFTLLIVRFVNIVC